MKIMRAFWVMMVFVGMQAGAEPTVARPKLPEAAFPLPLVTQRTNYSCGAAALLSVLKYWRAFDGVEQDLYGPLGTTRAQGTHPAKITEVARKFGLQAQFGENLKLADLWNALRAGGTVILDLQAWADEEPSSPGEWDALWEDGHYVVLTAMDENYLYAMDPSTEDAYTYVHLEEFMHRWHDYETENGRPRRYFQSAIFIRGNAPPMPTPLPTRRLMRLR